MVLRFGGNYVCVYGGIMYVYICDIWCGLAGLLIPVRLWVFTYVS